MRIITALCPLLLALVSCVSSRTHEDSFVLLHKRVTQMMAGRCEVAPITGDNIPDRRFEVQPLNSHCTIFVHEGEFLSQREWDRRTTTGMSLLIEFETMSKTNQHMDAQSLQRFAEAMKLFEKPEFSYDRIGVYASVEYPEYIYPESEKDGAAARRLLDEIVSLLKPYRH